MAEFETAQQWEDAWWAEVERARRMAPTDDGDAAARVAWTCMRARYGTPPPYAAAVVDARPYPSEAKAGVLAGPGPAPALEAITDEIRRLHSVSPTLLGVEKPLKLTQEQWDAVRIMYPKRQMGRFDLEGQIEVLAGRRVELVDDEADSDVPEWRPALGVSAFEPGPADIIRRAERDGRIRVASNGEVRIKPEPRPGWLGRLLDRMFGGHA